jgi:hypothetical protein
MLVLSTVTDYEGHESGSHGTASENEVVLHHNLPE